MEPQLDHYIGYTATTVNNEEGNLVIGLDNGPYDPILITVKEVDTKQPVMGLVLIETTAEKLSFAQTAKGGAQNVVNIDISGREVEVVDPARESRPVTSAESELPPDPSPERLKEGPEEEVDDGDSV
jgi:hypothetical protein